MKKAKKRFLTMKYHYKTTSKNIELLRFLCKVANLSYNHSLYELRKMYYETKQLCTYFDFNKLMWKYETNKVINTYQAICVNRCAYDNMKKYVDAINKKRYVKEKYDKDKIKNEECVMLPGYRRKQRYYPLITDQVRLLWYKNKKYFKLPLSNIVRTAKLFLSIDSIKDYKLRRIVERFDVSNISNVYIKIPKELYGKDINQIRIVPDKYGNHFYIEFSYVVEEELINEENTNDEISCALGIDIGINNLAACATTNNDYFLIDGKKLKSINQLFNKKKAKMYSELPEGIHTSKAIRNLYFRRGNMINDYINKAVATLMRKIKELNVIEVYIGWNSGFKKNGIKSETLKGKGKRRVNQNFIEIPLSKFKIKLIAKCKKENISITEVNESYTSKCSFIDKEEIRKHDKYLGNRVSRSLFIAHNKIKLHADINAACNILSKSISKNLSGMIDLMSRGITKPYRVYIDA